MEEKCLIALVSLCGGIFQNGVFQGKHLATPGLFSLSRCLTFIIGYGVTVVCFESNFKVVRKGNFQNGVFSW